MRWTAHGTLDTDSKHRVIGNVFEPGTSRTRTGMYSNSEPPEHEKVPTQNATFHISQYCMALSLKQGHILVSTCDQVRTF